MLEHHAAIISLCNEKLYGSALALLRVEFEAVVRGLWLRHVASENDLTKFSRDRIEPKFYQLIERIENQVGINSGLLTSIKDEQWGIFNSFTHTGKEALLRRIGKDSTGYENYLESDVAKALRFSGLIAVLAAVELSSLAKNKDLVDQTLEFARTYGE